jgi:hypothetical protein
MIELTKEEQQQLSEIAPLIRKSALSVIEARLAGQVGAEEASNIIAEAEKMVNEGMTSEEIVNKLREEQPQAIYVAVIPLLVPSITA